MYLDVTSRSKWVGEPDYLKPLASAYLVVIAARAVERSEQGSWVYCLIRILR